MKAKIIGIGGAGCKAVEKLYLRDKELGTYAVIDSDCSSLYHNEVEQQVLTLKYCTSPGSNPDREYRFVYESKDEIVSLLNDGTTNVILVLGCGGGSPGSVKAVAEIAGELGINVNVVCSIPFKFERTRKLDQAIQGIEMLTKAGLDFVSINLEELRTKYMDNHVSVMEAFAIADEFVIEAIIKTYNHIVSLSTEETH